MQCILAVLFVGNLYFNFLFMYIAIMLSNYFWFLVSYNHQSFSIPMKYYSSIFVWIPSYGYKTSNISDRTKCRYTLMCFVINHQNYLTLHHITIEPETLCSILSNWSTSIAIIFSFPNAFLLFTYKSYIGFYVPGLLRAYLYVYIFFNGNYFHWHRNTCKVLQHCLHENTIHKYCICICILILSSILK